MEKYQHTLSFDCDIVIVVRNWRGEFNTKNIRNSTCMCMGNALVKNQHCFSWLRSVLVALCHASNDTACPLPWTSSAWLMRWPVPLHIDCWWTWVWRVVGIQGPQSCPDAYCTLPVDEHSCILCFCGGSNDWWNHRTDALNASVNVTFHWIHLHSSCKSSKKKWFVLDAKVRYHQGEEDVNLPIGLKNCWSQQSEQANEFVNVLETFKLKWDYNHEITVQFIHSCHLIN